MNSHFFMLKKILFCDSFSYINKFKTRTNSHLIYLTQVIEF